MLVCFGVFFSVFTVYGVPLLLEFDQAEHAYIICSTTTPLCIFLTSDMRTPHVELPREVGSLTDFDAFCLIFSMCYFQSNFWSITTPRYLHVVFGMMFPHSLWTSCSMSKRVRNLVKWTNWNLSEVNLDVCVVAQFRAFSNATLSSAQVFVVVSPHASIATSSM